VQVPCRPEHWPNIQGCSSPDKQHDREDAHHVSSVAHKHKRPNPNATMVAVRSHAVMQLRTVLLSSAICGLSALAAQTDVFAEPSSEFAAAVRRLLQDELNRRQGLKVEGAGERLYGVACMAD
jgi:hypothetical protein